MIHWVEYFRKAGIPVKNIENVQLGEKIARIMEEHGLKVYDLEYIDELIEKTIIRNEKECSH